MDPFNAFFQQWSGVFTLISLVAACTAISFYVYNFIKTHEKKVDPKVPKIKAPKVKVEKKDRYNLVIKDDHNVIIFNTNYQKRYKAKAAVKPTVKELYKANKKPNTYIITKIK